ncbi:MAG: NADH-quinone oxidoreductase subunit J [Pirellulales bacterium]
MSGFVLGQAVTNSLALGELLPAGGALTAFCWAAVPWNELFRSGLTWGVLLGAASLLLLIPGSSKRTRNGGLILGALSLLAFGMGLSRTQSLGAEVTFWLLAALTVGAAAATISTRSAVYSAIWFAVSLLGTGGLLCMQNAQFLGIATIVVYAGAIVVTFLFVVMLAQPEGHDTYDRISWGPLAKPAGVLAAALLLGTLFGGFAPLRSLPAPTATADKDSPKPAVKGVAAIDSIDQRGHMASLGAVLFSRHLIAVEVGGTLLLAALVGAVAIVIQGRDQTTRSAENAEETHHG